LRKDWRRDRRDPPHHASVTTSRRLDLSPSAPATPGRLIPAQFTGRREGPPADPSDSPPPW
jgi:hypothetical protein